MRALLVVLLISLGCGSPSSGPADSGPSDSGMDAGTGSQDAGPIDAGGTVLVNDPPQYRCLDQNGGCAGGGSWTFSLAGRSGLPASARNVYLHFAGCINPLGGGQPPINVTFSGADGGAPAVISVQQACNASGNPAPGDELNTWFVVDSSQAVSAVEQINFQYTPMVTAEVQLLGWQ